MGDLMTAPAVVSVSFGADFEVKFRLADDGRLESWDPGGEWSPVPLSWRDPEDIELNSAIAHLLRYVEARSE
jgi:hypothetical protein